MLPPGKKSSQVLAIAVLLTVGVMVLPSLSGCGGATDLWRSAYFNITYPVPGLDDEAELELDRFHAALEARVDEAGTARAQRHFNDAFKRVRANYVEPVNDAALIDAAIDGLDEDKESPSGSYSPDIYVDKALHRMVASLDPHSGYLDAEEYRDINISTKGEFGGLGIRVSMDADLGVIRVIAPIEDTPADRAGVQAGDLITAIDGQVIKGMDLGDAVRLMRGAPGTDIRLTMRRSDDGQPFDITITRAVIKIKPVRWRVEGDIGYIRVVSFNRKVENGIARAFEDLKAKAADGLRGIVLDLRNNPGGLLDQSLALSDAFLNDGLIVSVRGRNKRHDRTYEATGGDISNGLPLVVLINGGSASASEIVASALKDNRRAMVMGTKSFGKGSVQTITPLAQLGALRLTTALYYGPDGHSIQAKGVTPTIVIRPAEQGSQQRQTEAAEEQGETTSRTRESDLSGAFPAEEGEFSRSSAILTETSCPSVGEEQDRVLGCAILYLQEGSTAKFLEKIDVQAALPLN